MAKITGEIDDELFEDFDAEEFEGEIWIDENWYKKGENGKVYWKDTPGVIGEFIFSFDMKTEFNFFADYHKLTPEQKAIFDAEEPTLASLKNG